MLTSIFLTLSTILIIAFTILGPTWIYRTVKHIIRRRPHTKTEPHEYDDCRTRIYVWSWYYAIYMYKGAFYRATMDEHGIINAGCFRGDIEAFRQRINNQKRHPVAMQYYLGKLNEFEAEITRIANAPGAAVG